MSKGSVLNQLDIHVRVSPLRSPTSSWMEQTCKIRMGELPLHVQHPFTPIAMQPDHNLLLSLGLARL
jgi:hypothetical protein